MHTIFSPVTFLSLVILFITMTIATPAYADDEFPFEGDSNLKKGEIKINKKGEGLYERGIVREAKNDVDKADVPGDEKISHPDCDFVIEGPKGSSGLRGKHLGTNQELPSTKDMFKGCCKRNKTKAQMVKCMEKEILAKYLEEWENTASTGNNGGGKTRTNTGNTNTVNQTGGYGAY